MSTVRSLKPLSIPDYLDAEEQGDVRHEFVDGFIYGICLAWFYNIFAARFPTSETA